MFQTFLEFSCIIEQEKYQPMKRKLKLAESLLVLQVHVCPYRFVKYASIRAFSNPYIPVEGHNRRFCPYTRMYGSEKSLYSCIFYTLHNIPNLTLRHYV